jgi:mono/diheme cytochrome c family protein
MRVPLACFALLLAGCSKAPVSGPKATAFGEAIIAVSGDKQIASVGAAAAEPVVVQVNDGQGNGIAGALVDFDASGKVRFESSSGLTGNDGQLTARIRLGSTAGRYSLTATTRDKAGKQLRAKFTAIALDYQQTLGRELSEKHCSRCHDPESTAERVSNRDNLTVPPHQFTDGAALSPITPANLAAIITHGGAAVGKSPEMPPYSPTLSTSEIDALVAYIRAIADPPYRPQGLVEASQ